MKIKIENLILKHYSDHSFGKSQVINFSLDDIDKAFKEKRFDKRSFQGNYSVLLNEWNNDATYDVYLERKKKYHIERIAYFANTGLWNNLEDPILVDKDQKTIIDGQHRVWAAKYLGELEIEAITTNNGS